jgi:hypothetical protein
VVVFVDFSNLALWANRLVLIEAVTARSNNFLILFVLIFVLVE